MPRCFVLFCQLQLEPDPLRRVGGERGEVTLRHTTPLHVYMSTVSTCDMSTLSILCRYNMKGICYKVLYSKRQPSDVVLSPLLQK